MLARAMASACSESAGKCCSDDFMIDEQVFALGEADPA